MAHTLPKGVSDGSSLAHGDRWGSRFVIGVMPLLCSDCQLPWSSGVHAFDASLHGYGVSYSESSSEAAAAVGKGPE